MVPQIPNVWMILMILGIAPLWILGRPSLSSTQPNPTNPPPPASLQGDHAQDQAAVQEASRKVQYGCTSKALPPKGVKPAETTGNC